MSLVPGPSHCCRALRSIIYSQGAIKVLSAPPWSRLRTDGPYDLPITIGPSIPWRSRLPGLIGETAILEVVRAPTTDGTLAYGQEKFDLHVVLQTIRPCDELFGLPSQLAHKATMTIRRCTLRAPIMPPHCTVPRDDGRCGCITAAYTLVRTALRAVLAKSLSMELVSTKSWSLG